MCVGTSSAAEAQREAAVRIADWREGRATPPFLAQHGFKPSVRGPAAHEAEGLEFRSRGHSAAPPPDTPHSAPTTLKGSHEAAEANSTLSGS